MEDRLGKSALIRCGKDTPERELSFLSYIETLADFNHSQRGYTNSSC
jgi:hypothetical protein